MKPKTIIRDVSIYITDADELMIERADGSMTMALTSKDALAQVKSDDVKIASETRNRYHPHHMGARLSGDEDTVSAWHRQNRIRGNSTHTCEALINFNGESHRARLYVKRDGNRWRWYLHGYANRPGGVSIEYEHPDTFTTMRDACASADHAATVGFEWRASDWRVRS